MTYDIRKASTANHSDLLGLAVGDDHTQYTVVNGRAGGQNLYGGTAANEDLTIQGTLHGTKTTSYVILQPSGGKVGIGTASPDSLLHTSVSTANTNTVQQLLTLSANSTGTAAAGFGSRILWELESSTTDDQTAAALDVQWRDGTDATRSSWLNLQVVYSGTLATFLHNYADATAMGYNIFMGRGAGNFTMSPAGGAASLSSYNIGLGYVALNALTTGSCNVAIGGNSSKTFTTGQQNTAIGYATLFTAPTFASGNVAIGYAAGYYETGSNKLFIDNASRSNEADARAKALVYGVFNAATASQTLALNAVVTVLEGLKVTNGSAQIGGTAARSGTAGTNRLDIFDGTAPVGTLANGVSIYSTTGECYIMDAAGNATLQSPHDLETGEWIFWSRNTVTGRTYRVDMERMVAAIEVLTGQKFTTETFESLN